MIKVTALTECWRCKSEITEYDTKTLLCEPCLNEIRANSPIFNRFDICEAWYAYALEWHNGQFSDSYRIFGRLDNMKFNPSLSVTNKGYDALTDNGKEIYENLVLRNY